MVIDVKYSLRFTRLRVVLVENTQLQNVYARNLESCVLDLPDKDEETV